MVYIGNPYSKKCLIPYFLQYNDVIIEQNRLEVFKKGLSESQNP